MSLRLRCVLVSFALLSAAMPARAQQLPPVQSAPDDDPRRGPRLEYTRGPAECLPEDQFRSEVAIAAHDGIDHLHAGSPDVVRVWFEKIRGGFRGTVEYTDKTGAKDPPQIHTSDHCHLLARWVASTVGETIPRPPAPTCPPCPAPACPACRVCGTSQPPPPCPVLPNPPPWRMDLSVGLSTYVAMSTFFSSNVGPVVAVAGEVRGEVVGVAAEFRIVLPSRTYALEPVPGTTSSYPQEFDLSQLSALLVPCARYKYFVGCAVAQFGSILTQNRRLATLLSYSFGPRLGFEVPFAERFAAFGFGEVLFAPDPAGIDFIYPDPENPGVPPANTGWTQSVASGFFGVGVSVKFR